MIFDKHADLKYKFGNRHFWAQGYYEFLFKRGCKDNISCFMQAYLFIYVFLQSKKHIDIQKIIQYI